LRAVEVGPETRLVALLGHPVAHSRSPRMQNAAFAARALDWAYVAIDVAPDGIEAALDGLVALGFAGANVTAPHSAYGEVVRVEVWPFRPTGGPRWGSGTSLKRSSPSCGRSR
jgi:hypothetical protein